MKRFWMWQVLHEYDKCYKTSVTWNDKCYKSMKYVTRT